ncbi:hypothetical protein [uncultured Thermomonospora sp.]|uniref:hypothetical protein n=1 Tax=uncultured Thermomonospora sp. TaxID=671175 RepID=UPI00259B0523|nr:hypothetical protein [uncultured Thermomonospora sp.]
MAIEWKQIGREKFERIVEALLYRTYSFNSEVRAVDGRGGDSGIDFLVKQGQRLRIFQLKYFPEGFSSEMQSRRRQIRKSFERAMQHSPYEWTLVVPCNLTNSERSFVENLGKERSIRISIIDRANLDSRIAAFPDLLDSFTRDQFLEAARILGHEQTVLAGGVSDLAQRVMNLGKVVDACDPHWTYDFIRSGGSTISVLRAKHPYAHEVSPITITLEGKISAVQYPGLSSAIERSIGYGTDDSITIPPEVIERLTIEGPEWISASYENVEVSWEPLPNPSKGKARVELRFVDEFGVVRTSHEAEIMHGGAGSRGFSLKVTFYKVATLVFLFSRELQGSSKLQYSINVEGAYPVDVMRAGSLIRQIYEQRKFDVYIDGRHLAEVSISSKNQDLSPDYLNGIAEWEDLASDLDVVQRHCGVYFTMPTSISARERISLRAARLLIEGHCVVQPEARTVTVTLSGSDSPVLRELLSGRPSSLRFDLTDISITVGGRTLVIGDAVMFHTRVVALNYAEALQALNEGRGAGVKVQLRPEGKENFRIFLPDKWGNKNGPLKPTPLGLPGYAEPV